MVFTHWSSWRHTATNCVLSALLPGHSRKQGCYSQFMYWRFNHSHRWGRHQQYDTLGSPEQNQGLHRQHDAHSIQVRLWKCSLIPGGLEAACGQGLSVLHQFCAMHDESRLEGLWLCTLRLLPSSLLLTLLLIIYAPFSHVTTLSLDLTQLTRIPRW